MKNLLLACGFACLSACSVSSLSLRVHEPENRWALQGLRKSKAPVESYDMASIFFNESVSAKPRKKLGGVSLRYWARPRNAVGPAFSYREPRSTYGIDIPASLGSTPVVEIVQAEALLANLPGELRAQRR